MLFSFTNKEYNTKVIIITCRSTVLNNLLVSNPATRKLRIHIEIEYKLEMKADRGLWLKENLVPYCRRMSDEFF